MKKGILIVALVFAFTSVSAQVNEKELLLRSGNLTWKNFSNEFCKLRSTETKISNNLLINIW